MLRRSFSAKVCRRAWCSAASASTPNVSAETTAKPFRTGESRPEAHSKSMEAKFYEIPAGTKKQLFHHGGLPKSYELQVKTFTEAVLMVRQPALEVIEYMQHIDFSRPAVRFVLYGGKGVGKSLTLAHIMHYAYDSKFIIVHVPWVPNWFKKPKEVSTLNDTQVDLPLDAAAWLIHFKNQNGQLLNELQLKTTKSYEWSKRESTAEGVPLLELIEHGITRVKFASDTIIALIDELKLQSTGGKCKTMVAIDGYNAFFHPYTRITTDNKAKISPDQVKMTKAFLSITAADWSNGVCVVIVDSIASTEKRMESDLPRYLLDKDGFEHLDPFVPIRVDQYSDKEFKACIDYYLDRKWIQNTQGDFDEELKFLSGKNPFALMRLCASL